MPVQVHVLFILDILNSVFNMIYCYLALVRHFGTHPSSRHLASLIVETAHR
jgi:hypothetical protein